MKRLEEHTDAEKIAKFNAIYQECENSFNQLCSPKAADYFDTHGELESLIEIALETEQEDWDNKIAEGSE